MQDKQDTEASTDEVQSTGKHTQKKNPGGAVFRTGSLAAPVQWITGHSRE